MASDAGAISYGSEPWGWAELFKNDFGTWTKAAVFQTASYLTDPFCLSHGFWRRTLVVDDLNPNSYKVTNYVRKFFLYTGMLGLGALSLFTTLPGMALRRVAIYFEKEPYIHFVGNLPQQKLINKTFTVFMWNVCFPASGHAISDGGVDLWRYRIDRVIDKVRDQKADVLCLQEVFDASAGFRLYQAFKDEYAHFYFNIGPKAVGVSSGLWVASKFRVFDPNFIPFPKNMLVGRTQSAGKGVFSFSLQDEGRCVARIHTTHLQHSETPHSPEKEQLDEKTKKEMEARAAEMELIMNKAITPTYLGMCNVLTGDLNLNDPELEKSAWSWRFTGNNHYGANVTWGGNGCVSEKIGNEKSPPLNLDHAMVVNGTAQSIDTFLVDNPFDRTRVTAEALSDHKGLFSRIVIP